MKLLNNIFNITLILTSLLLGNLAFASITPDAGQIIRNNKNSHNLQPPKIKSKPAVNYNQKEKPSTVKSSQYFVIKKVNFEGATLVTESELQKLFTEILGKEIGLTTLQNAVSKITMLYKSLGYPLTIAYLPPQTLKNGEILVTVLEGKLGHKVLQNSSKLSDETIKGLFKDVNFKNPVSRDDLNRAIMITQEQPGVDTVGATFIKGKSSGYSDLIIDVTPEKKIVGQIGVDNYGNRFTGYNRLSTQLAISNLTKYADQLNLNGLVSDKKLYSGGLAWNALLANNGVRGGFSFASTKYQLAREYDDLDAHGTANIMSIYGEYPILRLVSDQINAKVNIEHRNLKDFVDVVDLKTKKHLNALMLSANGSHIDSTGISSWNTEFTSGRLYFDTQDDVIIDSLSAKTQGSYQKLHLTISRDQRLISNTLIRASVQSQFANKNLDSSEKFSLGGLSGVRAYPTGEASGDTGWLARFDLRQPVSLNWTIGAGFDAGAIDVNKHKFSDDKNTENRKGYAVFVEGNLGNYSLTGTLAWRNGKESTSDLKAGGSIAWVGLVRRF